MWAISLATWISRNSPTVSVAGASRCASRARSVRRWKKRARRVAGGQCAIVNIWVDPNEYAPGTKSADDVQMKLRGAKPKTRRHKHGIHHEGHEEHEVRSK